MMRIHTTKYRMGDRFKKGKKQIVLNGFCKHGKETFYFYDKDFKEIAESELDLLRKIK